MKKRRVFIAINLPLEVKNKLISLSQEWVNLPLRLTKKDSLHLTLIFLGYLTDEQVWQVCQSVKKVASITPIFEIVFDQVCLGPKEKNPRLIWLKGRENPILSHLKQSLEKELSLRVGFSPENRPFLPHITLARLKQREWRQLKFQPKIKKEVIIKLPVNSIAVMESHLLRDGAEYSVLEEVGLGD